MEYKNECYTLCERNSSLYIKQTTERGSVTHMCERYKHHWMFKPLWKSHFKDIVSNEDKLYIQLKYGIE